MFINDVTKAIEETQSTERPALRKYRALFEASDPDRVDSQMPMSLDETMDDDENMTVAEEIMEVPRPVALPAVPEEEELQSQTPTLVSNAAKRKAEDMTDGTNDATGAGGSRAKRRALEDSGRANQAEPSQAPKEAAPISKTQQATQHKRKDGASTGAAPGKPDQDAKFLKALASRKKGKKNEDEFDREFNNLRISKPDVQQEEARPQEDYNILADFCDDEDLRGNFMVVMEMEVPERRRRGIRRGDERVDWEGRVDFKKFKRVHIIIILVYVAALLTFLIIL